MRWIFAFSLIVGLLSCDNDSNTGTDLPSLCDGSTLIHDNDLYDDGMQDPTTSINALSFTPPCLQINLSYGGGCQDHVIGLVLGTHISSPIDGGPKQQLFTKLIHDNRDDCDALITENVEFDLSRVLDLYDQESYTLFITNNDALHSIGIDF